MSEAEAAFRRNQTPSTASNNINNNNVISRQPSTQIPLSMVIKKIKYFYENNICEKYPDK